MANNTDNILAEHLANGLETASELIREIQDDVKEITVSVVRLTEKVETLEHAVNSLVKIVKDGNGEKPLVSRIATIETEMNSAKNSIEKIGTKLEKHVEKATSADQASNKIQTQGKWQIRTAVVTGVLGLIAAIVSAIYK